MVDGPVAGQKWTGLPRTADFLIEVEKGNVPGHSTVHKFGHGIVGQTLAPITISGMFQTPMAPVSLEFVSDSADDTALGTGASSIVYTGIGADYKQVIVSIPTAGLTPVPVPTDLLRLNTWAVGGSGTYATSLAGSHAGVLTTRVAGAGAIWSQIENTLFPAGQSELGAYTVPDGFRAYITQQEIHVDSAKSVEVILFKREGIDIVTAPFSPMKTMSHYVGVKGINATDFKAPMDGLPARTDIGYMGFVSQGTAALSVHFTLLLIEDTY